MSDGIYHIIVYNPDSILAQITNHTFELPEVVEITYQLHFGANYRLPNRVTRRYYNTV